MWFGTRPGLKNALYGRAMAKKKVFGQYAAIVKVSPRLGALFSRDATDGIHDTIRRLENLVSRIRH